MNASQTSKLDPQQLDQLCINTIRTLALDAVQKAESGHPGLPLGCAPLAYVLWTKFLNFNPQNPKWMNRDRFLLSAGHGSMLLYALLHLTGYDLPLEQLKQFRQWDSQTPGHPENILTPGVELTTGPLGQGFANGVGMAIAAAHLGARFNRDDLALIDHYIYAIVSDGDLMEGVSSEAASLAAHLKLGKLIYFYDDNNITIEGSTALAFSENVQARFDAYGWHTLVVENGNNLAEIETAIKAAQGVSNHPSLILVKTTIGYGMPTAGTRKAHSDAPGEAAVEETKKNLGWKYDEPFYVPQDALEQFRAAGARGAEAEEKWDQLVETHATKYDKLGRAWTDLTRDELPAGWEKALPAFDEIKPAATRVYSGEVINALAPVLPALFGGSADLGPSNNTDIKDGSSFEAKNYGGRIAHFGIREHAMGATMLGMSLYRHIIPFGGTFLCFADYMKPTIRLAALSHQQVIYVFTHDSIGLGEDGPTHQPIEQLAMLRAIPKLFTVRPADAHETREAWRLAITRRDAPTALILTRQKVQPIDRAKYAAADGLQRGGYILAEATDKDGKDVRPELILIATGSEVGLAMEAREKLQADGMSTRVVSLPCWELFDAQGKAYRDEVLPPQITKRLAIEAGASLGWARYVGLDGDTVTLDRFGASAPGETALKELGFNVENVMAKAAALR